MENGKWYRKRKIPQIPAHCSLSRSLLHYRDDYFSKRWLCFWRSERKNCKWKWGKRKRREKLMWGRMRDEIWGTNTIPNKTGKRECKRLGISISFIFIYFSQAQLFPFFIFLIFPFFLLLFCQPTNEATIHSTNQPYIHPTTHTQHFIPFPIIIQQAFLISLSSLFFSFFCFFLFDNHCSLKSKNDFIYRWWFGCFHLFTIVRVP